MTSLATNWVEAYGHACSQDHSFSQFFSYYASLLPYGEKLKSENKVSPYKRKILRGWSDQLAAENKHHADHYISNAQNSPREFLISYLLLLRSEKLEGEQFCGVERNIHFYWNWVSKQKSLMKENKNTLYALYFQIRAFLFKFSIPVAWQSIYEDHFTNDQKKYCSNVFCQLKQSIYDENKYLSLIKQLLNQLHFETQQESTHPTIETIGRSNNQADMSVIDLSLADFSAEDFLQKARGYSELQKHISKNKNNLSYQKTKSKPYKVFSKEFDQTAYASELMTSGEAARLKEQYLEQTKEFRQKTYLSLNKLKQVLFSQHKQKSSESHLHHRLDPKYLFQIISQPQSEHKFKNQEWLQNLDTHMTLLLDHSGSMTGKPILMTSHIVELFSEACQKLHISHEVLAFTTKAWHGGQSYKKWLQTGTQPNPGRLNDLLHIIYKSAQQKSSSFKNNIGLVLKPSLLKENIDGEALEWAVKRQKQLSHRRKIILVISDGVPNDDASLTHNPDDYLEKHLRQKIAHYTKQKSSEIYAITFGNHTDQLYSNQLHIDLRDKFEEQLFEKLCDIFSKKAFS